MLFNLFGKKEHPFGTERYQFNRTIDGKTFAITVDLAHEAAYLKRKTHSNIIMVAFTLLHTAREEDKLNDLLDDLTQSLRSITKSVFLGTITGENLLIGYITTTDPVAEDSVRDMLGTPKEAYTLTFASDPGWTFITETLFPTVAERQRVNNKGLIALIVTEQGDNATPPTGVLHSVVFKNVESGEQFSQEIAGRGYTSMGMHSNEDRVYPLLFVFGKKCSVTIDEVNAQTDFLADLAEQHQARYEGWQGTAV